MVYKKIIRFWQKPSIWHKYKDLLSNDDLNFTLQCQNYNGGFSNNIGSYTYLETCYYAVICLGLSGNEALAEDSIVDYILKHSCVDGGYTDQPGLSSSNLFNTFYATITLSMLDQMALVNKERLLKHIYGKRNDDGGYSDDKEPSSMIHTFWAILTLDSINSADIFEKDNIRCFIKSCCSPNGLFNNYSNCKYGYIEYTAYAIILNEVLSLKIDFDYKNILTSLYNRKNEEGYNSHNNNSICLSDTFWGTYLESVILNNIKLPNVFKHNHNNVWCIYLKSILKLITEQENILPAEVNHIKLDMINTCILKDDKPFTSTEKSISAIQYQGYHIYKTLPIEVKKTLNSHKGQCYLLDIDPELLKIQWENAYYKKEFFQFSNIVTRKNMSTNNIRLLLINKVLIIYDEKSNSAINEKASICSILSYYNVSIKIITFEQYNLKIAYNDYQLIIISGHNPEEEYNSLDFTNQIEIFIRKISDTSFDGLLFMNTCNNSLILLKEINKLEYSIINYNGNLNGMVGSEYISEILNNISLYQSIADVCRLARIKLLSASSKGVEFLNYQYWGNPNLFVKFNKPDLSILLNLEDTESLECSCRYEVWVASLDLVNDLGIMLNAIKENMNKGIIYHYIIPINYENNISVENLKTILGVCKKQAKFHLVDHTPFTAETVLYDPYDNIRGIVMLPVPDSIEKRCMKITDNNELLRIRDIMNNIINQK